MSSPLAGLLSVYTCSYAFVFVSVSMYVSLCLCLSLCLFMYVFFLCVWGVCFFFGFFSFLCVFFVILVPDAYVSHHGGQPSKLTVDHFVRGAEAAQICIAPNLGYL